MVNKTGVSALRQSRRNSCAGACLLTWLCMGWLVTNVAAQQGDLHPSISALLDQMIVVPASDTQPGGPSHTFRISQFEVTNEQFVAFLNHALAHPDDPSGAYIYVDANTGDVCVSNGATGSIGGTPCDPERIYFRPSVGGRVTFDGQNFQLASGPFGYGAHPVVGVTWYGATKFCNWLTLQAGWGIDEQAYIETTAANIDDWRPATISPSSWAQRGLNNAEREDLIQLWGFRLPMDGGAGNPNTFNEWYKAAAAFGDPATFQALYGFGRNQIENADANIRCSGDVFEDPVKCQVGGTTPVGHFDGVSLLSDGSTTNDTNNAYGLYDITGNVWEWVQEKVVGEFGDRRTRGGSYLSSNTFASLGFDTFRFADSAEANVGFRVAQAVPHALYVRPQGGLTISGPWGGHYDVTRNSDQEELGSEVSVTVENYTGQSVSLMISTNANWLLPADSDMWTVDPDASLQIPFAVTLSCDTPLAAGTYEAAITFTDLADGSNQTLPVTLDITTPASIETTESGAMERVYRSSVLATTLQVANASALPINVTARALDVDDAGILDWVTLREELSPTSFEVQPELFYALPVTFDLEALAVALESEEPVTGLVQARIQITDECTGDLHEQNVSVNVQPIFSIEAQQPLAFTASAGSEATPDSFEVTIKNLLDNWVEWQATVEPISPDDSVDWLRISSTQGSIRPQKTTTLRLETTPDVERLAEGTYEVALRLSSGDYQLTRDVSVTITALQVEPEEGLEFTGLRGGPFEPESIEYTVTNAGLLPLEWRASLAVDCDAEPRQALSWLQIEPEAGIIELPQGTRTVTIEPDPLIAPLLSQNAYQAEICFDSFDPNAPNDTLLASTFRAVLFEVGTDPRFETVEVPATDTLADGPEHSFRIGRYEVTNELYVEFLNDALADLGGFRGQYMFFDETTGEVFINDTVNGQRGEADEDLQQKLFDPAINPGIEFAEGEYRVLSSPFDYRYHPVTGVSWYGALKYCNWLTLEAGLPSEQRIYGEGTNEELTSWRPITISPEDWEIRSMSDAEYDALLLLWGYRLPLDESDGTVSPYNEWSKFATASSANGALAFDAVYGFGRDAITGADANFRCSGDPFEDEFKCQLGGTSPVGFFDGIQQLVDGPTNPTDNAYSLHDVSGNVWEWMQGDTGNENRWVRGGAFNSLAGFLATSERVIREADAVDQATGFRIAHTNPARLRVEPFSNYQESGVWGSLLRGDDDRFVIQVTNVTDTPVEFLLQAIEPWVQFEGTTTGLVEPRTAVTAEVLVDYPCDQSLSTGAQSSNIRVVDIEQCNVGPTGQPVGDPIICGTAFTIVRIDIDCGSLILLNG
ncbi:MAG: SUMF1/EgtB/PvdO family nonheme iron enzyme, partial [Phycisphaerae bacterium]